MPRPARHEIKSDYLGKELGKESDRAAVILAGAMFDEALLELIRRRLAQSPNDEDSLLDGAIAPIGTFSARIDLGYRLGLYHKQFWRGLHLVRRIRNKFAHHIEGCTFEERDVVSRIRELCLAVDMKGLIDHKHLTTRYRFEYSAGWMLYWLWLQVKRARRLTAPAVAYDHELETPNRGAG
jgi:hypothetical protein